MKLTKALHADVPAHAPTQPQLMTAFSKGAKNRRQELRHLTTDMYKRGLTPYDLSNIVEASPVTSDISLKATPSSFRDYTHELGHAFMALGLQTWAQYIETFVNPDSCCLGEPSTGTGYALGVHKDVAEVVAAALDPSPTLRKMVRNASLVVSCIPATGEPDPAAATSESIGVAADFSDIQASKILQVLSLLVHKHNVTPKVASATISRLPGLNPEMGVALEKVIEVHGEEMPHFHDSESIDPRVADAVNFAYGIIEIEQAETKPAAPEAKPPRFTIPETFRPAIDAVLRTAELPSIAELIKEIEHAEGLAATADARVGELKSKIKKLSRPVHESKPVPIPSHGELPSGKPTWIKASKALKHKDIKVPSSYQHLFDFDVPFFEWDDVHRDVPQLDDNYRFRWGLLAKLMWGIAYNKKPWVWGHTGTGKTTLIEQIAAILNWPFHRINFDSEITRMDLVGRDTLKTDPGGHTISEFVDGILPQAMQQPAIICNDELDFVRSDIAYVYQRALEDKGLMLTEDGGRLVAPHGYCRMVATANTQGQGDEFGLYQGARVQSQAFLDRFQCWVEVPYLDTADTEKLVRSTVPALDDSFVKKVSKYVKEHREAFKQAAILKPISPRGVVTMAEALAFFTSLHSDSAQSDAVRMALETTVLGSVTHSDAAKINELIDRTFN